MNGVLIGILCITLFYMLVFSSYKAIQNKRTAKPTERSVKDCSFEMLQMTKTNNNYEPLLDVLVSLDGDLCKLGVTLRADMRGYLDYEERK